MLKYQKNPQMGIDMRCGETTFRLGSYSSVQQQFHGILKAYLLYLKETVPQNLPSEMDVALQRVDNRRLARAIEETGFQDKKLRALTGRMYRGIVHLVTMQSCGSWSTREAAEILEALNKIRPYFTRISELKMYINLDNFDKCGKIHKIHKLEMEDILETSEHSGEDIHFF